MPGSGPILVWLRRDLRLADNPALFAAAQNAAGGQLGLLPIYIWAPEEEDPWAPGAASRWWLHHSLIALAGEFGGIGIPLAVSRGPSLPALLSLAAKSGATSVYWNSLPEPLAQRRDEAVVAGLAAHGMEWRSFPQANYLHDPAAETNAQGSGYQVFTPFYKHRLRALPPPAPLPAPKPRIAPAIQPPTTAISDLGLLPAIPWDKGLASTWHPGEAGAMARWRSFKRKALASYGTRRDFPAQAGISGLSPHLHFGEIGPRTLWHAVAGLAAEPWQRQLEWREFAFHLLHHFPQTPRQPLRAAFAAFPWRKDKASLLAWQKGRTGYPLVDAGMRELWATGFMHNRVRMVAGSFLVKHLLLPWQAGARWFWDTLVDADLANNTLGWQWIAGCGADAAPYFRVFNPVLQSKKFDPQGEYIRHWIPELSALPAPWIHEPASAPPLELALAGVELGVNYPHPIIGHEVGRSRALAAWRSLQAPAD